MAGDTVAEILERLREPVARSIYEAQVQQARKLAATYDTQFDRIKRVLDVADSEADRDCYERTVSTGCAEGYTRQCCSWTLRCAAHTSYTGVSSSF